MAKAKKKISLLLTGGTWTTDKSGDLHLVNDNNDINPWLNAMSELSILADLETTLVNGEEEDFTPVVWEKLAQYISRNSKKFDGFIITAKPEQIVNTTIALNFLLQNLPVTIIVTGSQMSGSNLVHKKELLNKFVKEQKGLGLRANLVNAVQIAGQALPGPAIMFGSRLISGTKAIWQNQQGINFFSSLEEDYWGRVDFGISLKSGLKYSSKATKVYQKINSNVLVIEDFIGSSLDWSKVDLKDYQAVIVKVNATELSKDKLNALKKIKIPTVIFSRIDFLGDKELPVLSDCTWPTALVKTMWAVSNSKDREEFNKKIRTNIIGEFN